MKRPTVALVLTSIIVCVGLAQVATSATLHSGRSGVFPPNQQRGPDDGQDNPGRSGVFPPNSRPFGQSYGQWSAHWWQWALALPVEGHPFVDSPNFDVSEGQSGNVWFLAAPLPGPSVRTCTIPVGKALFVGDINSEWSDLEGFATEAEQRANAVFFGDHIQDVFCTLDGVPVEDLQEDFRFQSPQFSFTAPTPWIFGTTGGAGTAVADGYYVFLRPLRVGQHVLHFGGAIHFSIAEGDPFDLDAAVDMTYNLTVAR